MTDKMQSLPQGTHVLIVEDEFIIALDVEGMVRERGAETVAVAHSLADARRLISSHAFTVSILDVKLRDGSGLELLDELRSRDIAVVLSTGLTAVEPPPGQIEMIGKPVGSTELIAAVLRAQTSRHPT